MSVSKELSALVEQVYCPSVRGEGVFSIERWLGTSDVRYFSLARHAMVAAFKILNIGVGDCVAVPEFICRDLLASLALVGAKPQYYPVDEKLGLACSPSKIVNVKAIIAVNYFGFPQDLAPFEEVSQLTGAIIIEDNAHGFLSRDHVGMPLGTRASLGVFSIRKTLPLVNGAALVVNNKKLSELLPEQRTPSLDYPLGAHVKHLFRKSVPTLGIQGCQLMTAATRLSRKLRTGYAIQPQSMDAEVAIHPSSEPNEWSLGQMLKLDDCLEVSRRRMIYTLLDEAIYKYGGSPVFVSLPDGTAPYVFPFRASHEALANIKLWLKDVGLECHLWPNLPDAILPNARSYYLNVWMVPFIW